MPAQLRATMDDMVLQLLVAKDILLVRFLMAFLSFLAWTTMDAQGQSTTAGLVCVYLCLMALLRQSPVGQWGQTPPTPNAEDEAAPTYGKSIADTNALLWRLLLIWLMVTSWNVLCADNLGGLVGTAGILALGLVVAGPGWWLAYRTVERIRKASHRMSREFAQNVAKAAEEYTQKVAAQKENLSATTLRKDVCGEEEGGLRDNVCGAEERGPRTLLVDSDSRSL
jgi:hypothetical protein